MITVVGEALVDLVVTADGAITATTGGAPLNVARACARLGTPVSLVAAVSTDRFGQRLMADLAADGVDTGHIQRTERPTTLAIAELDAVGAATYQFYLEGTSAADLAASSLPAATRAIVAGGPTTSSCSSTSTAAIAPSPTVISTSPACGGRLPGPTWSRRASRTSAVSTRKRRRPWSPRASCHRAYEPCCSRPAPPTPRF
jgi:fructokinase